ncbi:MAG: ABC transporter permease [Ideonella sp.]|nr:ABC transporter permease [Ideonella sp.]
MSMPPRPPMLMRSLAIQWRVIHALLMREVLTRFGRHNIGFFWLFVEPMLFTLGVTALWTALRAVHGSDIPITVFALTGYSSVLLWRNMPGRCVGAIEPNRALMFHRNVRVIDVFLARILLEFVGTTISFFVLSIVFIALEMMEPPENILQVVAGWLMLAWFGASMGLLMGAFAERSDLIDKIWQPLSYLLFPLSGAAFLVDAFPPGARDVLLLLPMVSGVEFLREGYFGSHFTPHYSLVYMASVCLVMTVLGLAEIRTMGKRMAMR